MRWDSTTKHTGELKYNFDQIQFSLAMPNFNTMLESLKICLPLTFEFRDHFLKKVSRANIAPKAWCNNILQRLSFRINGEELVQFPEDGLHSRIVWEYATDKQKRLADEGSFLPLMKTDQMRNVGFEHRQRQFAAGKVFNTSTVTDGHGLVASHAFESGPEYEYILEIVPDLPGKPSHAR